MFHWYTDRPMHGLPHFILLLPLCHVSISLLHMHVWFLSSCHMDPRSYYMYSMLLYSCYMIVSLLLIWIFPLLDMRAVDMRYVEFHIYCSCFPLYCSRFPLYCSKLSTELRSCYHVTCIMYCVCSCYIAYLTYQIINVTGVWGRLDGWLDLIGWCTGSILLVPLQGTVVLSTNCSMSSRYLIHAPLLVEGPGLSSQGFV